ncbi:MAG: hypothetical protein V1929_03435 [bacterium]
MTSPAFPQPLPSGANFECYPYELEEAWDVVRDSFESGQEGTRRRWYYPPRLLSLVGINLTEPDIQAAMGFIRDRSCGAEAFYVQNEHHYLWRPYGSMTLSTAVSGALAQRTYYVKITWYDGTNETTASQESSQLVAANSVLTLTTIPFPKGVTTARLYIGTSAGAEKLVSKLATDGATWTEPTTTVNDTSAVGQPVLKVASTTNFQEGDYLIVNSGGGREEKHIVLSIQAGVSLTFTTNLTYEHTLAQADVVQIDCTSGAAPPTSNTLKEEIKVKLLNNPRPVRTDATHWQMEMQLREDLS